MDSEAVSFEPSYQYYYLNKASHLQTKWRGVEGAWQNFAKAAVKLTPAAEGSSIYLRLMMSFADEISQGPFSDSGVSWEMLKQGFWDNEQRYPDSPWILNNFCKLACLAGEKETARKLFQRIGERPYIEAWSELHRVSEYKKWRSWAFDEVPSQNEKLSFPGGTEDVREMLILAKAGDPVAQYQAGEFYLHGELVEKDLTAAERWYRKAAEQGHREAQVSLGMIYFNGDTPFKKDFKEATKWYYLAAIQGDSNAASLLGQMFRDGYGLEKNLSQAYLWYSLVTQWKDPNPKEIAAGLSQDQLSSAELAVSQYRSQIGINKDAAECNALSPSKIELPHMILKQEVPVKTAPAAKLPAGNLAQGAIWAFAGGAKAEGSGWSITGGGSIAADIPLDAQIKGCLLVGLQLRHSRPNASMAGVPFYRGSSMVGGKEQNTLGTALLTPPTVKEKVGPWYQAQPLLGPLDAIRIMVGVAGMKDEDKKDSSTALTDLKVMVFPNCEEARAFGKSMYQP